MEMWHFGLCGPEPDGPSVCVLLAERAEGRLWTGYDGGRGGTQTECTSPVGSVESFLKPFAVFF